MNQIKLSHFPDHPAYRRLFWQSLNCDDCAADCCRHHPIGPPLSSGDVRALAGALGMKTDMFRANYTASIAGQQVLKLPCRFQVNNRCSVHTIRPANCREYPLIHILCSDNIVHLGVRLNCPRAGAALAAMEAALLAHEPALK
jgi:hypothetical protein